MNRYVPKRRFEGYVEPWKEKKLGEVTDKIDYGLNASAGRYDGENKYIRITDIDETTRIFLNTDLTSPECNLETADNYLLKNKDILFARTGASVGKSYIYRKSDGKVYFAGFLIRFRIDNNHSDEFIYQYTFTKHYKKFVLITSQRSGQPGINSQEYAEMKILFPSLPEQKHIGSFFKNLDKQIDKQGKKVEKLKNLKKAYLSEMFPVEGELFPRRRFKGYTEPWKQRKLGEVVEVNNGKDYKHLEVGEIPVYGTGGYMISVNKALSYKNDAIGIGRKGTIDNPFILRAPFWTVDTLFFVFPKDMYELYFLYNIFEKINWNSKDESSGIPSLSKKIIEDTIYLFPTIEEQKLIGSFFKKLDDEINLEQKKLEKLKQLKQAYLVEMFV